MNEAAAIAGSKHSKTVSQEPANIGTDARSIDTKKVIAKQINDGDPEAAVVVPVANAEDETTRKFMANLEGSTSLPLKVFLVQSSGPSFSFGNSVNAGIRAATGFDFIIGLDSDAFPMKDALDRMLDYARKHPQVGLTGVKLMISNGRSSVGWAYEGVPRFLIRMLKLRDPSYAVNKFLRSDWRILDIGSREDFIPGKMVGVLTTAYILRRQCFDDIGPFDEEYRLYYVDPDYSFRVLTSEKWFVSCCPSARVYHEYHVTATAQNVKDSKPDFDTFNRKWPKSRMVKVLEAAREGKFLIPEAEWK